MEHTWGVEMLVVVRSFLKIVQEGRIKWIERTIGQITRNGERITEMRAEK